MESACRSSRGRAGPWSAPSQTRPQAWRAPWSPFSTLASFCDHGALSGGGWDDGYAVLEPAAGGVLHRPWWALWSRDWERREGERAIERYRELTTPKYDIPRPSLTSTWLRLERIGYIFGRRLLLDSYTIFFRHFQEWEQDMAAAEDEDEAAPDFDLHRLWKTLCKRLDAMLHSGLYDWQVEAVRSALAYYVFEHCNPRLRWKLLKGSFQSAARKLAKHGVAGVHKAAVSVSRGQLLYSVADYIVHMSRKAWGHRVAVRNASTADERWELIKRSKISMMRELEISLLRMFCSGVGVLLGLTGSFAALYLAGSKDVSGARFEQKRGGGDQPMPPMMLYTIWFASSVGDLLVSSFVIPWYVEMRNWD